MNSKQSQIVCNSSDEEILNEDLVQINVDSKQIVTNFSLLCRYSQLISSHYLITNIPTIFSQDLQKFQNENDIKTDNIIFFFNLLQNPNLIIPYYKCNDLIKLSNFLESRYIMKKIAKSMQQNENIDYVIQELLNESKKDETKNSIQYELLYPKTKILNQKINECLQNEKFSKLPISIIHNLIEKNRSKIHCDLLYDFILKSLNDFYVLFLYLDLNKLSKDRFDHLYQMYTKYKIDNNNIQYFQYLHCNLDYLNALRNENDRLKKEISIFQKSSDALYSMSILFREGIYVEKNYQVSLDYMQASANLNNPNALLELGKIYENGLGIEKDINKAYECIQKSADLGNAEAMCILGTYYADGYIVEKNLKKSLDYFLQSSNLGNSHAYYGLGNLFEIGTERNINKAIECYQKSLDLGFSLAANKLGDLFYYGKDVEQDYTKAYQFYLKGSDLGCKDSILKIGIFYLTGKGVNQNFEKAIEIIEKLSKENNPKALYFLGDIYENGSGVNIDIQKAIDLYEQSGNQGYSNAFNHLAKLYEKGNGVQKDIKKALEFYKKAADLDNDNALLQLGFIYMQGTEVKKNVSLGIQYIQRSANLGNLDAITGLANSYENGLGVKKNLSKAIELYHKSADAGNTLGCYFLGLLFIRQNQMSKAINYIRKAADNELPGAYYVLGLMHLSGSGVTKDQQKSLEFLHKALELGDPDAKIMIDRINSLLHKS